MRLIFTRYIFVIFSVLAFQQVAFSGSIDVVALEKEIFELNNNLQFEKSQERLFGLLENGELIADEKYHVYLLLSYTYKRLFDYESTLKFLDEAQKQAALTEKKAIYNAQIAAEKAFVYFDTQNYERSSGIIDSLEAGGYKNVSEQDKSKLIMQQAYGLFLDKKYPRAEALYDESIGIIKTIDPCDLPMAYVKKMQLYNAMNRLDLAEDAYRKSMHHSDSCGIIKYSIYAKDELLTIYARRNEYKKVAELNREIDSLNNIYKKEEKLASLHNQQQKFNLANNDKQINQEKQNQKYLTWGLVAVSILLTIGLAWMIYYRKKKKALEAEFVQMKAELAQYISGANVSKQEKETIQQASETLLSDRQREVLDLLTQGKSNKEIASLLFITEHTVKYHIRIIYQSLNVKDRKDLFSNMR